MIDTLSKSYEMRHTFRARFKMVSVSRFVCYTVYKHKIAFWKVYR